MGSNDEHYLHLYNAQNAITVLEQKCNDRNTQYTVLRSELNNVKKYNIELPLLDYMRLLKHLEGDLSVDAPSDILYHTLVSLLICPLSANECVPIGVHRKIVDIACALLKKEVPGQITNLLKIIANCLPGDLYFYLVELNPETFADIFSKFANGEDIERKCLVMQTFTKLYLDNMISLTGIIALINLTMDTLLKTVIPFLFTDNEDLQQASLTLLQTLQPAFVKSSYRTNAEWTNIKQQLTNKYHTILLSQVASNDDRWHIIWIFFVKLLSPEIQKSANIMNKLLCVIESGLKSQTQMSNTWTCWKVLIGIYGENSGGIQTLKYVKLLSCPFKRQIKYNIVTDKMFDTWIYLFYNIKPSTFEEHSSLLVKPFLEFCFGIQNDSRNTNENVVRYTEKIFPKIVYVFTKMMDHSCENADCITFDDTKVLPCLKSSKVFELYWREMLQSVGELTRNLNKLNPAEYKWNDIASCVWGSILKLTQEHFETSDRLSEAHDEILRICLVLVQMSQGNNQLAHICLQTVLPKIVNYMTAIDKDYMKKDCFKLLDMVTHPAMVSCLDNTQMLPVYKTVLGTLISDGYTINFAGNKLLNLIKNTNTANVPNLTFDVACTCFIEKIESLEKKTADYDEIALALKQILIFPLENPSDFKMTDDTVKMLESLFVKFNLFTSNNKDLWIKSIINICASIQSNNEEIAQLENSKHLIKISMNAIRIILGSLSIWKEIDIEKFSSILQSTKICLKYLNKDNLSELHKSVADIMDNLCVVLISSNATTILKLLKDIDGIFETALNYEKDDDFSDYNKDVVSHVEKLAHHVLDVDLTEVLATDLSNTKKIMKYFINICKTFSIDEELKRKLSFRNDDLNSDSITHTPTRTPTSVQAKSINYSLTKRSPTSVTPKSRRNLDNDFVVIPKTPIQKPKYTEKQKEKMQERRADIPPLYNELSQSQDVSVLEAKNIYNVAPVIDNVSILELSTSDAISDFDRLKSAEETVSKSPAIQENKEEVKTSPDLIQDTYSSPATRSSRKARCLDFSELKDKLGAKSKENDAKSIKGLKSPSPKSNSIKEVVEKDVLITNSETVDPNVESKENSSLKSDGKESQDSPKSNGTKSPESKNMTTRANKRKRKELDSGSHSENESITSDTDARSSRKLALEMKRISMDIKHGDQFTNLGNRRSRRDPKKITFPSIRKKEITAKRGRRGRKRNTSGNTSESDDKDLESNALSDTIENDSSKESEKTMNRIDECTEIEDAKSPTTTKINEWLSKTPKEKIINLQSSTPKQEVMKTKVLVADNVVNSPPNNSPEMAESLDIVGSSQDASQSLFLKGSRSNSPNIAIKNVEIDKANEEEEGITVCDDAQNIPRVVLHNVCPKEKLTETDQEPKTDDTNLDSSKIISSPEHENVVERNNDLLNNTLDISPIKIDDPAVELVLLKDNSTGNVNSEVSSPLNGKRNKTLSTKSRSAQMLGLCNKEVPDALRSPVITKNKDLRCLSPMSVNNGRSAKLLRLSDKDLLTFKKEIPSPLASPSVSILKRGVKRKLTEDIEAELPPTKSKRVSFNDPIFTTKYLLKDGPSNQKQNSPCIRKQLIEDEKALREMNNDIIELYCTPIIDDKIIEPDSEEIMNIVERIELEKAAEKDGDDNAPALTSEPETLDGVNVSEAEFDKYEKECNTPTQHDTCTMDPLDDFSDFKELSPEQHQPIFPELATCLDPIGDTIDSICLKKCKPELVQKFMKNIFTISDVANMTMEQIKGAPLKSPKLANIKRILRSHARSMQESEDTENNKSVSVPDKNDTQMVDEECMTENETNNDTEKPDFEMDIESLKTKEPTHQNDLTFSALNKVNVEQDFEESAVENFIQRLFTVHPQQTYDVIQNVIKNVLFNNTSKDKPQK